MGISMYKSYLLLVLTLMLWSIPSESLALRSAMTGVNFDDVELTLLVPPAYYEQLYDRAIEAFAKAGLRPKREIDRTILQEGKGYILFIELWAKSIETCPGHYRYEQTAELQEWVYFDRIGERLLMSSPMGSDNSLVVTAKPDLTRLQRDLDDLLAVIIQHYRVVNMER
ncbi:hypothetical protein [Nitrospira japonica]|nr:hypothetical protein [Nitrospira japonica]